MTGISEPLRPKANRNVLPSARPSSRFAALQGGVINPRQVHDRAPDISSGDTGATATEQDAHLTEDV